MKTRFLATLIPALALSAAAQQPAAQPAQAAQQGPAQAAALLVEPGGAFFKAWLVAATKTSIRYKESEISTDTKDGRISDYSAIYIYDPAEYSAALDLYQARKYDEAKKQFAAIRERYKPIAPLPNSPAALASFYEMECMRKLGDLEGLSAALGRFIKDPLTRDSQLRQLELYVLWDAVRTKSWQRLDILAKEWSAKRLPGEQVAQVAYCHGLALEGLNKPEEALIAYSTAMTADTGASEEIARQSALRVLAIHKANPEVQNAIKVWGTENENKNSKGYSDLLEAAAVASLFELTLGSGTPLPSDYKTFLKYKPKTEVAPEG